MDPVAMAALVDQYYPAIRSYIGMMIRNEDDADDITQDFLQKRILNGRLLLRADHRRGRFRIYLKASLQNFINDVLRRTGALNKAVDPGFGIVSEENVRCAEENLDRVYCRRLLREAFDAVRGNCEELELKNLWRVLEAQVLGPAVAGTDPSSTKELMTELNVESERKIYTMKQTVLRMARRELERLLVRNGVLASDVDAEIDYIFKCCQPDE